MKRTRLLQLGAIAVALVGASQLMACHDAKKEEASVDASTTVAVASATASESASTPASARPPEADAEAPDATDAGAVDGGRKRRRLLDAGSDASAQSDPGDPPSVAGAASADPVRTTGKRPPVPMANDNIYGSPASASAAPALKKKPMPDEDPWGKSPPH